MKTNRDDHGFTLIEILVAVAIIAAIGGITYATYAAATQSVSRCRAKIALEQEARAVLRRMAREMRCCYVLPSNPAQDQDRGAMESSREEEHPDFLGRGNSPGGELLQLLTAGGITRPDESSAGLSIVAYRFDESDQALFRRQARPVDAGDLFSDDENWWLVARDVRAVELKYFDGTTWREEWDSRDKGELPRAVSVEIAFETEGAARATFTNTILIACRIADANRSRARTAAGNEKDSIGVSDSHKR